MHLYMLCALAVLAMPVQTHNDNFYERPGVTATEIFQRRGFKAEDVYLVSADGYRLKLIHAWNPLISKAARNKREPILFVHGILADQNMFIINSFDVAPKDFSALDLSNDSIAESMIIEPSARSLPMLALNFGHDVWVISRRGFPGSQQKIKTGRGLANRKQSSTSNRRYPLVEWGAYTTALGAFLNHGSLFQSIPFSFDYDFWNFSLDEQAIHDLPMVVDYVAERSNDQKIALVAHSSGGAISLMMLADKPEIAQKLSSAILWSEAFSVGFGEVFEIFQPLLPLFENVVIGVPPAYSSTQIQALLGLICAFNVAQRTVCEAGFDLFIGPSGGRAPIKPEYINSQFYPTSAHELAQYLQCARYGGHMHKYNFGSKTNLSKYNQTEPPAYNLSAVTLTTMSFYVGRTDLAVTEKDVRWSANMLKVPHEFHLIDTEFNHQGYFFHDDNARLVVIPSLQEIHRFGKR